MTDPVLISDVSSWTEGIRSFRGGRVYIELINKITNKKRKVPHAIYVWLKNNPSFISIPKGYEIHHLDEDCINDDISNLVIMHKVHHHAYHLKNLIPAKTIVEIDREVQKKEDETEPRYQPRTVYMKSRNIWLVGYTIKLNGKGKHKYIYSLDNKGTNFKTKEEAEKVIKLLWPHKPWEDRRYEQIRSVK